MQAHHLIKLRWLGLLILCSNLWSADIAIKVDRDDGIYAAGETARWTIDVVNLEKGEISPTTASYKLLSNGLETIDEGSLTFINGHTTFSASRDDTGTLLLKVEAPGIEKAYGGAAFDPEKLAPVLPRPDDFDKFWEGQKKIADAIPLNPKLTL